MQSILFISLMNGAPWGGSEELWYRAALYASQKGGNIGCAVYHWPEKEDRIHKLAEAGCTIFWLPNKGRSKKNLVQKLRYKITKSKIKKFALSLPLNEYDMVVLNQGGYEILSSPWKSFYEKLNHYALLFHNYHPDDVFKKTKADILKAWIIKAFGNFFASDEIKKLIEDQLQITIANADKLLNPITFNSPLHTTSYPELISAGYLFVMLAALDINRKAQDNLIIALSSSKWKDRKWILHLYGEGKDKDLLQQLILKTGLQEKVFLMGYTSNVKRILHNAHLVLQITHKDAMPLTVVEAMAMSRPVVVSNIGDMPQWVQENINGWVSKNASPEEIDRTLETAWSKKDQWDDMGKKSFQIFCEKFPASPEEYFLQQLDVF